MPSIVSFVSDGTCVTLRATPLMKRYCISYSMLHVRRLASVICSPGDFIRITDQYLRDAIYSMVNKEIETTGQYLGEKKKTYMKLKLEGINECAELWVAALMEGRDQYILGRRTIPEMDLASLACAIQNIWLVARAEGIGMGWVSFFHPNELAKLLSMPQDAYPAAILCIGHVDNFYPEPLLKTEGWDKERGMEEVMFENNWNTKSKIFPTD